MDETGVIDVLSEKGPLTGSELLEVVRQEALELWRLCAGSPHILARVVGRRFLRLDRAVTGYARLSPSIRREFLTYTLLDLNDKTARLEERAAVLTAEIRLISSAKRRVAAQAITSAVESLKERDYVQKRVCFVLAGDITYDMAHRVPRPERSTGKMVRGSDLDIVVVTRDDLDPAVRQALDDAIYLKKHFLLISPSHREEIDYLIKDLGTVRRQVVFDTFEHMVACKILAEGELLYGAGDLFADIRALLVQANVPGKLAAMEVQAARNRAEAERTLSEADNRASDRRFLNLFYTTDEGDEIY